MEGDPTLIADNFNYFVTNGATKLISLLSERNTTNGINKITLVHVKAVNNPVI